MRRQHVASSCRYWRPYVTAMPVTLSTVILRTRTCWWTWGPSRSNSSTLAQGLFLKTLSTQSLMVSPNVPLSVTVLCLSLFCAPTHTSPTHTHTKLPFRDWSLCSESCLHWWGGDVPDSIGSQELALKCLMLLCICPPCRDTSVQSTRVDPIPSIPWATSHRLVTGCAAVWHGVWRHPLWTWRGDPNGTGLFQTESLLRSVYPVIEIVYYLSLFLFCSIGIFSGKEGGKTDQWTDIKHTNAHNVHIEACKRLSWALFHETTSSTLSWLTLFTNTLCQCKLDYGRKRSDSIYKDSAMTRLCIRAGNSDCCDSPYCRGSQTPVLEGQCPCCNTPE